MSVQEPEQGAFLLLARVYSPSTTSQPPSSPGSVPWPGLYRPVGRFGLQILAGRKLEVPARAGRSRGEAGLGGRGAGDTGTAWGRHGPQGWALIELRV